MAPDLTHTDLPHAVTTPQLPCTTHLPLQPTYTFCFYIFFLASSTPCTHYGFSSFAVPHVWLGGMMVRQVDGYGTFIHLIVLRLVCRPQSGISAFEQPSASWYPVAWPLLAIYHPMPRNDVCVCPTPLPHNVCIFSYAFPLCHPPTSPATLTPTPLPPPRT